MAWRVKVWTRGGQVLEGYTKYEDDVKVLEKALRNALRGTNPSEVAIPTPQTWYIFVRAEAVDAFVIQRDH